MTTPITNLIQDRIEELEKNYAPLYDIEWDSILYWRKIELEELLQRIQELEANSIESLLEELLTDYFQELTIYSTKDDWEQCAWYYVKMIDSNIFWKTPKEALLKLRDKLNSNI